jgi:hypothetical protein
MTDELDDDGDRESWDYDSGPFCSHYHDCWDCEEPCATCGHKCCEHWDGAECHADGCDCEKFNDGEEENG